MHPRTKAIPALLGVAALAAPAAAHADTTLTFKEVDKGSTFMFVDNPPKAKNKRNPSLSPGDMFVLTNPIVDNSGKHIGKLRATCTVTSGGKTAAKAGGICVGVFSLPNGTLDAMVNQTNLDSTTTAGAIVGGTGAYAGARGNFLSKSTKTGGNDTVNLLG